MKELKNIVSFILGKINPQHLSCTYVKELCVFTLNQQSNVRSSSKPLFSLDINLMDDVSVTPIFKNRVLSYHDACSPERIMFYYSFKLTGVCF